MCRTQCILTLVAMYVGLVHSSSWDFATAAGKDLRFYFRGKKAYTENITTGAIGKMTYDPVGNRMFFFDDEDQFNFIFSYDMTTKQTEPLVWKPHENERIEGIAFDPVEQILFWNVYYYSSIYWLSLKSRNEHSVGGNFLIKTRDLGTSTIAIDSCNGYIYWTSEEIDQPDNKLPALIERARFDGSGREVVIGTGLQMPRRLIIDPQTQRLYWTDGTYSDDVPPIHKKFSIESAELNGKNRTILYRETGLDQPMSLAVSEDSIYWTQFGKRNAWHLPKNISIQTKPEEIPIAAWYEIVTNYKVEQQLLGVQDCDRLKSLLRNDTLTVENDSLNVATDTLTVENDSLNVTTDKLTVENDSLNVATDTSIERPSSYCVHGTKVNGVSQCRCKHGYIGERCDVPVCHNYCFQGDCIVSNEGQPQCRCNAGYSGQRCEVNVCQGYCLNAGDCSLNEGNEPICKCQADYEGERCEVSACLNRLNKHFQTVSLLRDALNTGSPGILDRGVKSTCAANIF